MNSSSLFDRLTLSPLEPSSEAGLCMVSLPWPRQEVPSLMLNGRAAGVLPLGQWPESPFPRRVLLFADADGAADEPLTVEAGAGEEPPERPEPPAHDCSIAMESFEKFDGRAYAWERHLLRVKAYGRSLGIAMGLKGPDGIHWWEACGFTTLNSTASFTEVKMAGSVPCRSMTEEEFLTQEGYLNEYLHKHNWLSASIYLRLHRNGVCEVYAHHINNKFVDEGADLPGIVPVIGFEAENKSVFPGHGWDGSQSRVVLDGIPFDMSDAAPLATEAQPGSIAREGRFLVWQPYAGVELYGGVCPETRTGNPFIFQTEDKVFPKGMARTVRFSFSLSSRSPVVRRYMAPAWWYGVCEELLPEPLLPVSNHFDEQMGEAIAWITENQHRGGFEDGSVPRHSTMPRATRDGIRHEPGWEGEVPYSQFLFAWRRGDAAVYRDAMRSAYHFTDVAVDHAAKLVRMHGYAPDAFSLPMNRMLGTIAAYFETGDPYLYETAEAVTANSHWIHKNSWPRMAVGRDACYVRSAVFLYRYFGIDFFRTIAREGCMAVALTQRANGSIGDQGGGSGIHQWSGYISKPWMGLLALNGVLDYLELFPKEPVLFSCVKKFADWLMGERWCHEGSMVWSYQHDYHGRRAYYDPTHSISRPLPTPTPWHHASLARLLGFCAISFGDDAYLEAWYESWEHTEREDGDHASAAILQFLPWLQAKLWNAMLVDGKVVIAPHRAAAKVSRQTRIFTPEGPLPVELFDVSQAQAKPVIADFSGKDTLLVKAK